MFDVSIGVGSRAGGGRGRRVGGARGEDRRHPDRGAGENAAALEEAPSADDPVDVHELLPLSVARKTSRRLPARRKPAQVNARSATALRRNGDRHRCRLSMNPRTRAHASRQASACSVIFRSKKECGASGYTTMPMLDARGVERAIVGLHVGRRDPAVGAPVEAEHRDADEALLRLLERGEPALLAPAWEARRRRWRRRRSPARPASARPGHRSRSPSRPPGWPLRSGAARPRPGRPLGARRRGRPPDAARGRSRPPGAPRPRCARTGRSRPRGHRRPRGARRAARSSGRGRGRRG